MKTVLSFILCLFLALPLVANSAEQMPFKQITIITPFPVGSGPDSMIRKVNQAYTQMYGIPVIMENKPGGQGAVAFDACNKAVDSVKNVNLCYVDSAVAWALPLITGKPELTSNFKDLFPSHYGELVIITSPNIKNLDDLKAAIKKNPNYGSWSIGSTGQLTSLEILKILNLKAEHIPYKDYSQWYIDTSTERLAFGVSTLGSSQPMMAQGKIRYLALAAKTRDPKYPDLPTVNELLGPAGKSFVPYRAIGLWMVKKDMPVNYQKALISSFKVALHDPEVKVDTETRAYKYWPTNDAETPKVLKDEKRQYLDAIKEFNIEMRQ